MGLVGRLRLLFQAKAVADAVEKEVGSNMDWQKTSAKASRTSS